MVLLGRVDQLEVDREGPDDPGLGGHVEPLDDLVHLALALGGVAPLRVGAQGPVQQPQALLGREQLRAALLDQHPPEEVAEQPDVAAERLVTVVVAGRRGLDRRVQSSSSPRTRPPIAARVKRAKTMPMTNGR